MLFSPSSCRCITAVVLLACSWTTQKAEGVCLWRSPHPGCSCCWPSALSTTKHNGTADTSHGDRIRSEISSRTVLFKRSLKIPIIATITITITKKARNLYFKKSLKTNIWISFSQTQQEGSLCNHRWAFHKWLKLSQFSRIQASNFPSDTRWGAPCWT